MFVRQLDVARRRRFDLSSLKKGTSTGPLSLIKRIRAELGIDYIMSKWGATEGYGNLSLCDLDDPLERRLGSHGRIYEQFAYRIADPVTGCDALPEGHEGEIQVHGAAMQGYFDDAEATEAVILPDGWLRTGDLGRLDGAYLYYTGRIKDMLKIGGENVAAAEIEQALTQHRAVLNVAVVGKPDPEWGELPVAYVELAYGMTATETELIAHCRRLLAGIKTPRRVVIVAEMPQTGSGKVDKNRLKAGD
jgi:fatty-acyl-CoA synthase/long-chain acyl-CoA synthetase